MMFNLLLKLKQLIIGFLALKNSDLLQKKKPERVDPTRVTRKNRQMSLKVPQK